MDPLHTSTSDAGPKARLEWTICEDETQWRTVGQRPAAARQPKLGTRRSRHALWTVLSVLLLGTLVAGTWTWRTAQLGLAELEEDIADAVDADLWTSAQGRTGLTARARPAEPGFGRPRQFMSETPILDMRDPADHARPVRQGPEQFRISHLAGEWAVVQVTLPTPSGTPALRQTRVYRQTPQGWQRVRPAPAYWGASRRLETRHFILDYYAQDEVAVKLAATELDTLYPTLWETFFVGSPTGHRVVQVDPAVEAGTVRRPATRSGPWVTASPATYLAPLNVSEADLLAQAIVLALLDDLSFSALRCDDMEDPRFPPAGCGIQWYPLLEGMRLWQMWALDLPLAKWRAPVVTWFLQNLPAEESPHRPGFRSELCAWHQLWMLSPSEFGIPLDCATQDITGATGIFLPTPYIPPQQLAQMAPVYLNSDMPSDFQHGFTVSGRTPHPASVVAMATVVDYAAATYGTARLPVLVANLDGHQSWDTLIPAVFGVEVAQFEAGWRAYLEDRYGLDEQAQPLDPPPPTIP